MRGDGGRPARSTAPLKVAAVAAGLAFPHAAQAVRVTHRTRPLSGGKWHTFTVYVITSMNARQASPAQLAEWIRGNWQIEMLHRDVSSSEDASQIRTGSGPQVMSALRNLSIWILKQAATPASPPPAATTPGTPPGYWPYSESLRHDRNGHNVTVSRPWLRGTWLRSHLLSYIRAMPLESVVYSIKGGLTLGHFLYSWLPPRVRCGIQGGQGATKWGKFV